MSEESKTGILKTFTPVIIQGGMQDTWKNPRNVIYYRFKLTFEKDGAEDVGTALSTKTQPNWEIGKEYNYIRKVVESQGAFESYVSFSKLDKVFTGSSGGSSYKSPEQQKSIAIQIGTECAVEFMKSLMLGEAKEEELKSVAQVLTKWLLDKSISNEHGKRASHALRTALKAASIKEWAIETPEGVIERANRFFDWSDTTPTQEGGE